MSSASKDANVEWSPSLTNKLKGCVFSVLWLSSIIFGYWFLLAPLLPMLFINRKVFRRTTDLIITAWESFTVSVLEIVFGVRTYVTGDAIRSEETSLIILNHPTRLDWGFLWCALLHSSVPPAHNAKFVIKDAVKNIPGIGWILQMGRSLFIDRCWKTDEQRIGSMIEHFAKVYNTSQSSSQNPQKQPIKNENTSSFQIVLFPEGTNVNPISMTKSNMFADKSNLKRTENVLHPRTTGFSYITTKMRECECLDAVYDITVAYPDGKPVTEQDVVNGMLPKEIHFHIKRYGVQTVPTTWIGLEKWIQEVWREKDHMLNNIYKEGKKFPALNFRQHRPQIILPLQYLSLMAFFAFIYFCTKLVFFSSLFSSITMILWIWIVVSSLAMVVISRYTNGVQEMEMLLEKGVFLKTMWKCFKNKTKLKASLISEKQD